MKLETGSETKTELYREDNSIFEHYDSQSNSIHERREAIKFELFMSKLLCRV